MLLNTIIAGGKMAFIQTKKNVEKLGIGSMGPALESAGLRVKYAKDRQVARVGRLPWIGKELYGKILAIKEIEDEKNAMRESLGEELKAAGRDFRPEARKAVPAEKPAEIIEKSPEEKKEELIRNIKGKLLVLGFEISMVDDKKAGVSEDGKLVAGDDGELSVIVSANGRMATIEKMDVGLIAHNISSGFGIAIGLLSGDYQFERRKGSDALAIVRDEVGALKVELRKEAARIRGDLEGTRQNSDAGFAEDLSYLTGKRYSADDVKNGFIHTSKQELRVNGCLRSAEDIGDMVDKLRVLVGIQ